MKRSWLLVLLFVLFAVPASAQVKDTVKKSAPFTVTADQAGADATFGEPSGFRLYVDGKVVLERTALEAGCSGFPCSPLMPVMGGLAAGTYVLYLESFNVDGAAASDTLTLLVTQGSPKRPLNIRIIK